MESEQLEKMRNELEEKAAQLLLEHGWDHRNLGAYPYWMATFALSLIDVQKGGEL